MNLNEVTEIIIDDGTASTVDTTTLEIDTVETPTTDIEVTTVDPVGGIIQVFEQPVLQNVFVSSVQPSSMPIPGIWVETYGDGSVKSFWVGTI